MTHTDTKTPAILSAILSDLPPGQYDMKVTIDTQDGGNWIVMEVYTPNGLRPALVLQGTPEDFTVGWIEARPHLRVSTAGPEAA